MEEWVSRALARWPNVPALYGWLRLDRRGRWLIRGETISRWQIVETINRNYAADERGCWFFQNGPQRGYMDLDYAPLILRPESSETLSAHTGVPVARISQGFIDEEGALLFATDLGPGLLADAHVDWALDRLRMHDAVVDERAIADVLALPSGSTTSITMRIGGDSLRLSRLDSTAAPESLGFVREPKPLQG